MNKRLITVLGLVMALVLLSLITVQINWIRNAYIVKEQQFDQMVHQALSDIVNVAAREEIYSLILEDFPDLSDSEDQHSQNLSNKEENKNQNPDLDKYPANKQNPIIPDSLLKKIIGNLNNTNRNNIGEEQILERHKYINDLLSRMFDQNSEIGERITGNEIEAIANEIFLDLGIDINFEYAVKESNNKVVFQSKDFNPKGSTSVYRVRLYPEDFNSQTNYLDVYFPNKRNFIFRSLAFIGISSGVLTVLIVFTFAFTLFVIFRQKRLSDIKNDFVNNMTHELKTPISTVSLASQLLGDDSIPIESKDLPRISGIINQESKRLGYLVEKVLQIATIDKGDFTLNLDIVDMHELIETVLSNFYFQIESKGGLLIPSLHAENTNVMVDNVHMTNVISNLLDNAIKYTPINPEIYIETSNVDHFIQVSVKDNGIGISRANQKRVFERFYRVPTGNLHNVKGFGLGLNYVKKIVEMHKGIIEIESEPEKGTIVSFRIPLKTTNNYERN